MRQANSVILNAVTLPTSGTTPSAAIQGEYIVGATAQAVFSDNTAAGTLKLQGSNDASNPNQPSNWSDVPSASVTITAGTTLACTPNTAAPLCYNWLRVVFVSTAGTGTGTITARLQTFGV